MKSLAPGVLLVAALLGIVFCLVQPETDECPGGVCKPKVQPPSVPPAKPKPPVKPKPH